MQRKMKKDVMALLDKRSDANTSTSLIWESLITFIIKLMKLLYIVENIVFFFFL